MPAQRVVVGNETIKQFNILAYNFIITLDKRISFLHYKTGHLLIELRLADTVVGFQVTYQFA